MFYKHIFEGNIVMSKSSKLDLKDMSIQDILNKTNAIFN